MIGESVAEIGDKLETTIEAQQKSDKKLELVAKQHISRVEITGIANAANAGLERELKAIKSVLRIIAAPMIAAVLAVSVAILKKVLLP